GDGGGRGAGGGGRVADDPLLAAPDRDDDPAPAGPARPARAVAAARREGAPVTALLEVCGLTVRFGGLTAVSRLDFTVDEGALVALIGPNGAGKTTAFNVITGVYAPSEGSVRFAGAEIGGAPAHRICAAGVARTFQNIR